MSGLLTLMVHINHPTDVGIQLFQDTQAVVHAENTKALCLPGSHAIIDDQLFP